MHRLLNAHVAEVKDIRHNTYHFMLEKKPLRGEHLNWAEELHSAIRDVIEGLARPVSGVAP